MATPGLPSTTSLLLNHLRGSRPWVHQELLGVLSKVDQWPMLWSPAVPFPTDRYLILAALAEPVGGLLRAENATVVHPYRCMPLGPAAGGAFRGGAPLAGGALNLVGGALDGGALSRVLVRVLAAVELRWSWCRFSAGWSALLWEALCWTAGLGFGYSYTGR